MLREDNCTRLLAASPTSRETNLPSKTIWRYSYREFNHLSRALERERDSGSKRRYENELASTDSVHLSPQHTRSNAESKGDTVKHTERLKAAYIYRISTWLPRPIERENLSHTSHGWLFQPGWFFPQESQTTPKPLGESHKHKIYTQTRPTDQTGQATRRR